jgi:hypothetical protein
MDIRCVSNAFSWHRNGWRVKHATPACAQGENVFELTHVTTDSSIKCRRTMLLCTDLAAPVTFASNAPLHCLSVCPPVFTNLVTSHDQHDQYSANVPLKATKLRVLQSSVTTLLRAQLPQDSDKSNPITGLDRPLEFQEFEAPRFPDNRHMKVVMLSALRTGRSYPPRKYSWYSFLLGPG